MTSKASASAKEKLPKIALSPNYKWYVVGMLWFIAFFNYADRQAIFSVFPLLQRELHLDTGAARPARLLVRAGSTGSARAVRRQHRRSRAAQNRRPRGGSRRGASSAWRRRSSRNFSTLLFFRAAEGSGRNVLLSRLDVAHQRLSRPEDTRSRAMGTHQTERLYRNHRRRILRGPDRPELWLALVVRGLRRPRRAARTGAEEAPGRAGARSRGPAEDFDVATASDRSLPVSDFLKVIWTTPTGCSAWARSCCDNFVADGASLVDA